MWVRWSDHLAIGSVDDVNILFSGDLTHQGRWTTSSSPSRRSGQWASMPPCVTFAHTEDRPSALARIWSHPGDARARLAEGAEEGAD